MFWPLSPRNRAPACADEVAQLNGVIAKERAEIKRLRDALAYVKQFAPERDANWVGLYVDAIFDGADTSRYTRRVFTKSIWPAKPEDCALCHQPRPASGEGA